MGQSQIDNDILREILESFRRQSLDQMTHGNVGSAAPVGPLGSDLRGLSAPIVERARPGFYRQRFNEIVDSIRSIPEELTSFPPISSALDPNTGRLREAGEVSPEDRDRVLAAVNAFGPSNLGFAGIMAGAGAKTANMTKLLMAEDMLKKGASRDEIWTATGWMKGVDGKWRFEIPDDLSLSRPFSEWKFSARADFNQGRKAGPENVGHFFKHDELNKAYPDELMDFGSSNKRLVMNVSPQHNKGGSLSDDVINVGSEPFYPPKAPLGTYEMVANRSTLLHELQHAIQQREGFARGGSPSMFRQIDKREQVINDIRAAADKYWDQIPDNLKEAARTMNRGEDKTGAAFRAIQKNPKAKEAWASYTQAIKDIEWAKNPQTKFDVISPTDQYFRLAGEAEARMVQKRMNLTPAQRASRPPWMDYDVPEAQQIVRFGEGPSMATGKAGIRGGGGGKVDGMGKLSTSIKTGQHVEFPFARNTQKSPNMGKTFGQDVEPAGQYVITGHDPSHLPSGWVQGTKKFNNPLVMDWGGGYEDPSNWKRVLSAKYGGKTGKRLSSALKKDGYDGIITIRDGDISEIVDLLQ